MKQGRNLVDLLTKLPVELHIPSYSFCGPGTKLYKRLQRGDKGINPLDEACKFHDIEYAKSSDLRKRHAADKVLEHSAWERVKARDASLGEKSAAWLITNVMKAKTKLGMGVRPRRRRTKRVRKHRQASLMKKVYLPAAKEYKKMGGNIQTSLRAARYAVKTVGGKKQIRLPRVIPIPRQGGFLPFLIPLFAGLSALGGLAGGISGIVKTVNAVKTNKALFDESKRHNKVLESLKLGKGIEVKKYKKGMGLFLSKN